MKIFRRLMPFIFLAICISCKLPSDEIAENFKKVNESLEKSNDVLKKNSYEYKYRLIQLEGAKHPELVKHAGNLYYATDTAIHYVDKLQEMLNLADSSGSGLDVSGNLIVRSPNSDTLAILLQHVSETASTCPIGANNKSKLSRVLSDINALPANAGWKKDYFELTPTIAAITILSKFKNDIINAATLAMDDMAGQIKNNLLILPKQHLLVPVIQIGNEQQYRSQRNK
jgi:hypothetical protein